MIYIILVFHVAACGVKSLQCNLKEAELPHNHIKSVWVEQLMENFVHDHIHIYNLSILKSHPFASWQFLRSECISKRASICSSPAAGSYRSHVYVFIKYWSTKCWFSLFAIHVTIYMIIQCIPHFEKNMAVSRHFSLTSTSHPAVSTLTASGP